MTKFADYTHCSTFKTCVTCFVYDPAPEVKAVRYGPVYCCLYSATAVFSAARLDLKHRAVKNLDDIRGKILPNNFVAPSASVVGNVELMDHSCVWYGAVVRGGCKTNT